MIARPTKTPAGLCRRKAPAPAIVAEEVDTGTSWQKYLKMIGAAKANLLTQSDKQVFNGLPNHQPRRWADKAQPPLHQSDRQQKQS